MTRSMKDENRKLFQILISSARTEGVEIDFSEEVRYLQFCAEARDLEQELLQRGRIRILRPIKTNVFLEVLVSDAKFFIAVIGEFVDTKELIEFFTPTRNLTSLFILAVNEARIEPLAGGFKIKDSIESLHEDIEGYCGHSIESISDLFPKMFLFSGEEGEDGGCELYRFTGLFLLQTRTLIPIELPLACRSALSELFINGDQSLPFEIIIRALYTFSFESIFLALYRVIENLYFAPWIKKLIEFLPSEKSHQEIAEILEENIAWRPKEVDALARLLECCDRKTVAQIGELINPTAPIKAEEEKVFLKAAERIYKIRNHIVHFRPIHRSFSLEEEKWALIIENLSVICQKLYDIYGNSQKK